MNSPTHAPRHRALAALWSLGGPAACRYFLNWFDDTPRDQMCALLLDEVRRTLAERFPIEEPASASQQTKAA